MWDRQTGGEKCYMSVSAGGSKTDVEWVRLVSCGKRHHARRSRVGLDTASSSSSSSSSTSSWLCEAALLNTPQLQAMIYFRSACTGMFLLSSCKNVVSGKDKEIAATPYFCFLYLVSFLGLIFASPGFSQPLNLKSKLVWFHIVSFMLKKCGPSYFLLDEL